MKNSRRRLAVLLISIVAIISLVVGTFAWYSSTNSMTQLGSIGDMRTFTYIYLDKNGVSLNVPTDENGLYILSTNPNDDNYLGNFRVNVNQKGYSHAYVRVKFNVQWTMPDGTVTQNIELPFTFGEKWYDNRQQDYCVYYTESTGLFASHDKSIITGFDFEKFQNETLSEIAIPKIAVTAESVQINRYPQMWGMDTLPWEVKEAVSNSTAKSAEETQPSTSTTTEATSTTSQVTQ